VKKVPKEAVNIFIPRPRLFCIVDLLITHFQMSQNYFIFHCLILGEAKQRFASTGHLLPEPQ
jgi:hypothetical protein